MLRRIFRNFTIVLSGSLLSQIFLFFGLTYVARILGPSLFGVWNFAQSYTMYLFRLNELGLEVVGIKKISSEIKSIGGVIVHIIAARLLLALLLLIITIVAYSFDAFPPYTGVLVVACSISVLPIACTVEWVFEGLMSLKAALVARITKGLLFVVLVVLFVNTSEDVVIAIWIYFISIAIPALGLLAYTHFKFRLKYLIDSKKCLSLLREALPIGIATIVANYNLFIGTFILTYFLSAEALGHYSAAQRIFIVLGAFTVANAHRILIPILTKSLLESRHNFISVLSMLFRIGTLVSFMVSLISIVVAEDVIVTIFGGQYTESVRIFILLSISLAFYLMRSVIEIGYIAVHLETQYLFANLVAAFFYTFLIPLSVQYYGLIGVGYATILAELLTLAFHIFYFHLIPVSFAMKTLTVPALSFCVSLGGMYLVYDSIPAVYFSFPFVLYVGTLFMFNGISMGEIKMASSMIFGKS